MNPYENCVIIFDKKQNKYVDMCKNIESIENNFDTNQYIITFNDKKQYPYNTNNVEWIRNPQNINIESKLIFNKNESLTDIVKVMKFENWYKIFRNNNNNNNNNDNNIINETYRSKDIKIIDNFNKKENFKNILEYLKEITKTINDDGKERNFLYNQLKDMNIRSDSILSKIINNKELNLEKSSYREIIFPFLMDGSQKKATKEALESELSIIEGPPGTGKTQTILNIIANVLYRGQTVAVVSGSNEATRNVLEKMEKSNLHGIGAYLGSTENIKLFFEKNYPIEKVLAQFEKEIIINTDETVLSLENKIDMIHKYKLDSAKLNQSIKELEVEKEISDAELIVKNNLVQKILKKQRYTSGKLLELAAIFESLSEHKLTSFFNRARMLFRFGIPNIKKIASQKNEVVDYLQNKYYEAKITELKKKLLEYKLFLDENDAEKTNQLCQQLSVKILQEKLHEKLSKITNNNFATNYRFSFNEFINRFPVIFSTTHALRSCSGKDFLYDYLIIDESGQADLVSSFVALSCARKVVFVGDLKQLSHIVKTQNVEAVKSVFSKYQLPDFFEYSKNSILQAMVSKYGNSVPNTLLLEHYRCDPQIIEFCNKRFYNNQLIIQTKHKEGNGIKIIKTKPNFARGRINERQVDVILKEILPFLNESSVGILAPYCKQVNLLTSRIQNGTFLIDTVHKFQGKEKNVVIMSTVSNKVISYSDEKYDFLDNPNLINVAISRAKNKLILVVSEMILNQKGTLLSDFSKYAGYYCSETIITDTKVYSIYDLMYKEYSPILEKLKKRLVKISKYDSENITGTIIKDICESGKFGPIDFKFEYPLRKIIKPDLFMEEKDADFVNNVNTHCDFVIYSLLNKSIVLIIEIDGSQHLEMEQKSRDSRKDRLLKGVELSPLRLTTTSINVKEKIEESMNNIYKKGSTLKVF